MRDVAHTQLARSLHTFGCHSIRSIIHDMYQFPQLCTSNSSPACRIQGVIQVPQEGPKLRANGTRSSGSTVLATRAPRVAGCGALVHQRRAARMRPWPAATMFSRIRAARAYFRRYYTNGDARCGLRARVVRHPKMFPMARHGHQIFPRSGAARWPGSLCTRTPSAFASVLPPWPSQRIPSTAAAGRPTAS